MAVHVYKIQVDFLLYMIYFCIIIQGKAYTHIEPEETSLNDLCLMSGTGLLFMANEAPKILTYYVPVSKNSPRYESILELSVVRSLFNMQHIV